MNQLIRHQTVRIISKLIHPLTESNLISVPEYREIVAQLKHLAEKGTVMIGPVRFLVDGADFLLHVFPRHCPASS